MEKTFTHSEVEKIVKDCVTKTMNSTMEWVEKETDVVVQGTDKVLRSVELKPKANAKKLKEYVLASLADAGIEFKIKE